MARTTPPAPACAGIPSRTEPPRRETLTGRERVRRILDRQPVDRLPIDLGMHYSTGISAFAYAGLRRHLGLDTDRIEIVDPVQFLARVDEDVRIRFHLDTILLHPGWARATRFAPRQARSSCGRRVSPAAAKATAPGQSSVPASVW